MSRRGESADQVRHSPESEALFLAQKQSLAEKNCTSFCVYTLRLYFDVDFLSNSLEEANTFARIFMENFGIPVGLTIFVVLANLPIYMTLSLDSHIVRLPAKIAVIAGDWC